VKIGLFSVRDRVADDCIALFEAKNPGIAMRGYLAFIKDSRPKHTAEEDYELVHFGYWDNETMEFSILPRPQVVTRGGPIDE